MITPRPLPVEVLSHILDGVESKGDLCSISLASRTLREEGQRALFRHPGTLEIRLPRLVGNKFLDSIIASPHRLALAVLSFDARLIWEQRIEHQGCVIGDLQKFLQRNKSNPKNLDEIKNFIEKLERALVLMRNLKNLRIVATRNKELPETMAPLPSILRQCTFQLHAFYWEHIRSDDEAIIADFLPHQRALRALELPSKRALHGKQHARALQSYAAGGQLNHNLQTLCGSAEMTLGLLTNCTDGKPPGVWYMRWTMGYAKRSGIDAKILPNLSRALRNVRLFHFDHNPIGLCTSQYDPVDMIFPMLDNLRVLRFSSGRIQGITQEHVETLSKLPKLRVVVLVIEIGIDMCEDDIAKAVADSLFSRCRNLEYIDVESLRVSAPSERHRRYTSQHHRPPRHGEYSWENRHLFLQSDAEDM